MDKGDLVAVTSHITGGGMVRRVVKAGEVGVILGPTESLSFPEHQWWRLLLDDGEITLPEWAMREICQRG